MNSRHRGALILGASGCEKIFSARSYFTSIRGPYHCNERHDTTLRKAQCTGRWQVVCALLALVVSCATQAESHNVVQRVAMEITGHKTRAVFERYNIVSAGDLQDAARRIDRAAQGRNAEHLPEQKIRPASEERKPLTH